MPRIELIYDINCPNVDQTKAQLQCALDAVGLPGQWQELNRDDPDVPDHAREYGSPTILIDGRDVAGTEGATQGNCCRVYMSNSGITGVPSAEMIATALRRADVGTNKSLNMRRAFAALPAVAVGLLPKLVCPACWPAYAGLLSSVGLGFLIEVKYLLPITAGFFVVALAALAIGARKRHGQGPFVIGCASALTVLVGKFLFESNVAMYGGIGLLVAASIWNAWPARGAMMQTCPSCEPPNPGMSSSRHAASSKGVCHGE